MFVFSTLVVAASLVASVTADHGHGLHVGSRHHVGRSNLQKRFSGRATYYAVGLGGCGQTNVPSDPIVALNTAQFGSGYPGPNCFKPITICANGHCEGATIMDACPTCNSGDLDLSEGLFKKFASTDAGVFQMTWTFDGDEPAPSTTKKPDPTTTKQPDPEPTTTKKPEPTTTWEEPTTTSSKRRTTSSSPPPETTSTHEPTTSSTTSSTSTTSSSTSTVVSTTSSTTSTSVAVTTSTTTSTSSSSAAPSASASSGSTTSSGNNSGSGSGSNLADAQQIMIAFGRMVSAANQ